MKIAVLGAGPAGLYFAILMKLRDARHQITVYERNRPDDTFGWGVVFSDQTLGNLHNADPVCAQRIEDAFVHWGDIAVHFKDTCTRSGGHGFAGIGRKKLLSLLQARAREVGVELCFEHAIDPDTEAAAQLHRDFDLIIAADGANSRWRQQHAQDFQVDCDIRPNKYIWLGTRQAFDAFTFAFRQLPQGWIWAHAYRFDAALSTFIVECSAETWQALGFEHLSRDETLRRCHEIFAQYLGEHELMSNAAHLRGSAWLSFMRINCGRWRRGKVVLMGDAAHTAHFSIGSGTKLALEDAIGLAEALHANCDRDAALERYEELRRIEVLKLQSAARNSAEWFEHVPRYVRFAPPQFTYALLTRSQRLSHENLRVRDADWLTSVEDWFAQQSPQRTHPPAGARPPMFVPLMLRELRLANRVVVSPMDMYSSDDGTPGDFHLVHLGARAQGGAALVCTEMTCVSRVGRITTGCAGMYKPEHVDAWRRIVQFIHRHTPARICMQLGHAGPKGSTCIPWRGDSNMELERDAWQVLAPSTTQFAPQGPVPHAMTSADMAQVKSEFVHAAQMANECGFDMLELHCAHGYLLSAFITPLLNQRRDEYGGSLANRLRYPLEVFRAVRTVWPQHKPMSVRISATDWTPGGIDAASAVEVARAFKVEGADVIDVSAGQTSLDARPVYGRMFQTPLSDQIRNEADIATMAVGNIYEFDHVNSIVAAGRADLCCLARPHLTDPYWTLHAAAQQRFADVQWPVQYTPGQEQLERLMARAAQAPVRV